MPKPNLRINIPINADELIALARKIQARHEADGAASPLNGLKTADFKTKTDTAATKNTQSKELYRQAEKATQDRDLCLGQSGPLLQGTVRFYVTAARDLLQGLNKGNETALGDWGFEVDTSPKGGSAATAARKAAKAAKPV